MKPVHEQAKQLLDEMRLALETETEASKMLLDNSNREIERRNMRVYGRARALNKLARLFLDRLKKIIVPGQVSYDQLSKFAQETQRIFIVEDVDIKNWFPRISPFFILDRRKFLTVHEKAKLTLSSLNDFIAREYVKTKTLEETFQLINEVKSFERQLVEIQAQKVSMEAERSPVEKEIAELQLQISELQTKGPIDQLNLLEAEIETLSNELKNELRHLQKPFIKVQALATQGGGAGLTQDELKRLGEYMANPVEALVSEETRYPILKQILEKMNLLLEEDKLKLKSDKARKAVQSIDEILKRDSLAGLQTRSVDIVASRAQLLASSRMDETRHNLSLCKDQLKQLEARKKSLETHEAVKMKDYQEIQERIFSYKKTIEKNVFTSLGKKIQIL